MRELEAQDQTNVVDEEERVLALTAAKCKAKMESPGKGVMGVIMEVGAVEGFMVGVEGARLQVRYDSFCLLDQNEVD